MKTYIGIDIGKRKCDYCVKSRGGRILERGKYQNTAAGAGEFAEGMAKKYNGKGNACQAACETTANLWVTTYGAFEAAGIPIRLANTFKMAVIAKTGKKTDEVDAEKIANILRMDMIPECYVPPAHIRGLRAVVRHRIRLVQSRTRVINRSHGTLDRNDKKLDGPVYYAKNLALLETAELGSPHDEMIIQQCAREIRYLTGEIRELDRILEAEADQNEYARLLASMTGVGPYTALLLAVEIGNISRFAGPKNIVSWAGLCPTIHQSGDKKYIGRMKKLDTSSLVNWAMCEAANTAVRHDPRMAAVYESAKKRHAGKHALAVVVVANKMATVVWHILKTKTPYESRNEKLYRRKLNRMKKARKG